MPSRRQIREAVVQFLYCFDLEGGADPADLREPFWQFVTESDRRALVLATWKALQHLNAGREARHAELSERLPAARAILRAEPALEPQARLLDRIAELEDDWTARYDELTRVRRDDADDAVSSRFSEGFDALFRTDRELSRSREEFHRILADRPDLRPRLEPVAGSLNRLERISQRVRMLEDPEHFPDQPVLTRVRRSRAEMKSLREAADRTVDAVLSRKDEIDAALAEVVENFAPERIDPIDRAILRLGAWEILANPDAPKPVAIDEAIEIARKFGTTDSARFVNGILDRIPEPAKEGSPGSPLRPDPASADTPAPQENR